MDGDGCHRQVKEITGSGIVLRYDDLCCLRPNTMLNDEIINAYFHAMCNPTVDSYMADCDTRIRAVCFNSFFYSTLVRCGGDMAKMVKWTNLTDIAKYNYIFVPVHVLQDHWCLVVVNIQTWRIDYYDSFYSPEQRIDLSVCTDYVTHTLYLH